MGGYVAWDAGALADGSDSKARLVASKAHWPEMRALILVVSAEKKDVSSTAGMQATVATSSLFRTRARDVVPARMKEMEEAIQARDFEGFAKVTMRESNGFHACCLDTEPPIRYLNDVSWAAMKVVEGINESAGRTVAAYTFDAGPNCVVYHLEKDEKTVIGTFRSALGSKASWKNVQETEQSALGDGYKWALDAVKAGVISVITSRVDDGPISVQEHLVDELGKAVHV